MQTQPSPATSRGPRLGPVHRRGKRVEGIFRDTRSRDGQTLVLRFRVRGSLHYEAMKGDERSDLKAAIRRRDQVKGEGARGTYRRQTRETLAAYVGRWAGVYSGRSGRGLKPETLRDYRRNLELHVLPRLGHLRLAEIEPWHVAELVAALEAEGRSANGRRNIVAALRAVLATAHAFGDIPANPLAGLRLAQGQRGAIKHLEPAEARRLIEEVPEGDRLFFRLLLHTGCRISEFIELRWSDLNLEAGTVHVARRFYRGRVDTPKSAYGVRTIPLTRTLVADLRKHRLASPFSGDGDLIFATARGGRVSPSNLSKRMLKPAAERAGVAWASLHTFRHTCATLLPRKGLRPEQVQAWCGHHSAAFTLATYVGRPDALPVVEALDLADADA